MKTPKEKAKELVDKYAKVYYDLEYDYCDDRDKQCSLIAVDEIINTITNIHWRTYVSIYIQEEYMNIDEAIQYYNEVKQEIELL